MRKAASPAEIAHRLGVHVREVRAIIKQEQIAPSVRVGIADGYSKAAVKRISEVVACATATKRQADELDEILIAFHESAHAVTAHVLGVGVLEITIQPSGSTLGFCSHNPPPDVVKQIAITTAGPWGMYQAGASADQAIWSAGSDTRDINTALLQALGQDVDIHPKPAPTGDPDRDRRAMRMWELEDKDRRLPRKPKNLPEFEAGVALAKKIVAENWTTISILAGALLRNRKMDGAHVLHIIEGGGW